MKAKATPFTVMLTVLTATLIFLIQPVHADPNYDTSSGILTIPSVTIDMANPPVTNVQLKYLPDGTFEFVSADVCGSANSTAQYMVTFEGLWSSATHPNAYPSNAHFSPFIGLSHNSNASFFSLGSAASPGVKNMAETGGTSPLDSELDLLIQAGSGLEKIQGNVFDSPGSSSATFTIDAHHPLVTITSMIAPSPDWFVAIKNVNLYENCQWVDQKEVTVVVYDAGTDSGSDFTSDDSATAPAESISLIGGPPLAESGTIAPMGKMTFTKIN